MPFSVKESEKIGNDVAHLKRLSFNNAHYDYDTDVLCISSKSTYALFLTALKSLWSLPQPHPKETYFLKLMCALIILILSHV